MTKKQKSSAPEIRPSRGGNVYKLAQTLNCRPEDILDFSVSINPLGFPDGVRAAVNRALDMSIHYPDPNCTELTQTISHVYGSAVEQTIVANGTTEIFSLIPKALGRKKAVIPSPCYIDYARFAERDGMTVEYVLLREDDDFMVNWERLDAALTGDELVYLARPNNPTGTTFDTSEFLEFASSHPDNVFVIDEAYLDFAEEELDIIQAIPDNTIVTVSLTKFYGIPGVRLGFAVAPTPIAARLRQLIPTWSVGNLAQAAGVAMLQDRDYASRTRVLIKEQRAKMVSRLTPLKGLKVYPGIGNFLFIRSTRPNCDAHAIADHLLKYKIAIRICDNYIGLDSTYFRIAVNAADANERILCALEELFTGTASKPMAKPSTPALMIQGIASNAGKSVLTTALCRILFQDGVRVAPFKAQNMSLNSFVTHDGLEMGRAQVTQAQASRLDPDVRMNPILLKPCSDTGSQVIVNGKPVGNMPVKDYIAYKDTAFQAAKDSYDSLAAEYDVIILEGAGSPGEVNLKAHDIVNMRMARYANAGVLLAGDIDRGGVFASFIGTMDVLSQWERDLVKGFIVNRFRGDASLLSDATDYTEQYTGKPTLGIVPYLTELGLPEEDSVEFKCGALDASRPTGDHIEIAVIDLPHISNFTDIDALRAESDVYIRVIRQGDALGTPDAIILPGSKNVLKDLETLQKTGIAGAITALQASSPVEIIGICGGFQMLGTTIADPLHIESDLDSIPGLGLLNVTTELAGEKTLTRVETLHPESGQPVFGYEIHHGQTTTGSSEVFLGDADTPYGLCSQDGTVWGTYLHGVFDSDSFRRWFINRLRMRKGLQPLSSGATYDIEPALDRLAEVVRASIDMDRIYAMLGL